MSILECLVSCLGYPLVIKPGGIFPIYFDYFCSKPPLIGGFPWFSFIFPGFSQDFHDFPRIFLRFSWFPQDFPRIFMIFLGFSWFPQDFPRIFIIFPGFSCCSQHFPGFSHENSHLSWASRQVHSRAAAARWRLASLGAVAGNLPPGRGRLGVLN